MKTFAIFDLDGTLLNPLPDLSQACNHALEEMGFPTHSHSLYRSMIGNGTPKLIERALPEDARTQKIIDETHRKFTEYYDLHLTDETRIYNGVKELLEVMVKRDIKLAVASNKYQSATSRLIDHFFPEFPWAVVMGHRNHIPHKPDPSIIFSILLECPTPKAEVIYIGDSGVDMETAYRACVDSIGVTWGYRTRADLISGHAEYVVKEPVEILDILNKYNL